MACSALRLVLLYWTLSWVHTLTQVELQELEEISTWVITRSFPCSATCGLGLRTQELCPIGGAGGNISSASCKLRTIRCLETWQCGLKIQTAAVGQRLVLDCLEEVVQAMGRFAFVVSWRFACGIITTDDSLFVRYDSLSLDKVVLDPLREEDSGTYRCDVLDTAKRRVKRMYKGVKVLSPREVKFDYAKGLTRWEDHESLFPNITLYSSSTVRNMALISVSISAVVTAIIFLIFWGLYRRSTAQPAQHRI